MKKQILNLCKRLIPAEQSIIHNKYNILSQLFSSEFQSLPTKQSIDLFSEVKKDFTEELEKRLTMAEQEIINITEYFNGK